MKRKKHRHASINDENGDGKETDDASKAVDVISAGNGSNTQDRHHSEKSDLRQETLDLQASQQSGSDATPTDRSLNTVITPEKNDSDGANATKDPRRLERSPTNVVIPFDETSLPASPTISAKAAKDLDCSCVQVMREIDVDQLFQQEHRMEKYVPEQAANPVRVCDLDEQRQVPLKLVAEYRRRSSVHVWVWNKYYTIPGTIFIPIAVAVLIFGAPPLGEPDGNFPNKLVYLLLVNPAVYCCYAGLLTIFFYAILDTARLWYPFKWYLPPILSVYLFEVMVMSLIYPFTNTFPMMGIIPLFVCTVITSLSLDRLSKTKLQQPCWFVLDRFKTFRSLIVGVFFYIITLSAWVLAYQNANDAGRAALPFILLIVVYAWKKYLLAKTESYPYEVCMLLSGLWFENLDDVFQSLVFALVPADSFWLYALLFVRKFLENLAYLLFWTQSWFKFRVWIKDYLKRLFTCKLEQEPAKPIWEDTDDDDRGHSNMHPAYLRRQAQFFFLKVLSQIHSFLNYMIIAGIFRKGYNSQYYPLGVESSAIGNNECLTADRFDASIIFTALSIVASGLSGYAGYAVLKRKRTDTFVKLWNRYQSFVFTPVYLGFVCAILTSSALLAFSVVQYHNRIWFAQQPTANISEALCRDDDD